MGNCNSDQVQQKKEGITLIFFKTYILEIKISSEETRRERKTTSVAINGKYV